MRRARSNAPKQTFEAYKATEPWQKLIKDGARAYAESMDGWFLICGQPGSGKTHLCTAIARQRLLAGDEVRYMPWREKIAEIIIPDDGEESNALTINKDLNGQPFALLKARLCGKFPKYTGGSTIPNVRFAMLNGKTTGNPSPTVYTSLWPKVETGCLVGAVYDVDVSGGQMVESVLRSTGGGWGENMGVYGSANSTYVKYFTDSLWAKPITSIGGTSMLIYPGCKFVLYGVRA